MNKPNAIKNSSTKSKKESNCDEFFANTFYVSTRKLDPQITVGFAQTAPRFVAGGKGLVKYEP